MANKQPRRSLFEPLRRSKLEGTDKAARKPGKAPKKAAGSELGAAIMAARTAAGLSQVELAARIETDQANIVRLEKGRTEPKTRTLQRIAEATGHKLVITFTKLQGNGKGDGKELAPRERRVS